MNPTPDIRHVVAHIRSTGEHHIVTLPKHIAKPATRYDHGDIFRYITSLHGEPVQWFDLTTAISVRQPWAWALLHAGKDVENRTSRIARPGWHYLHASQHNNGQEYHRDIGAIDRIVERTNPRQHLEPSFGFQEPLSLLEVPRLPGQTEVERGGIIGAIRIATWTATSNSPWFFGPLAATIDHALPLAFIPCLGSLGAFQPQLPPQ